MRALKHGTELSDFTDPYLDPATGILRNLVGAVTQHELDEAEAALSFARSLELDSIAITPSRDLDELCAIHRHLFQDVYSWAGHIRTVDMKKNLTGSEFFLQVSFIERAAGYTFDELSKDERLGASDKSEVTAALAHHYDQLNYIHPFREGNGRVQRTFWDRVAEDAGWSLDWPSVTGAVNNDASRIAAEQHDLGPLIEMLGGALEPLN